MDAGWQHDPYGRFAKRYWDGTAWTAKVVDAAGAERVDPMGTSTVVPFALPPTAVGDLGGHGPQARAAAELPGQATRRAARSPAGWLGRRLARARRASGR